MIYTQLTLLTQRDTLIIGNLAKFFGVIIEFIFNFFSNNLNIESLGLTIIVFTIVARLLMLPLAIKQQKSMAKVQKMQPELKKIQDKYKDKKDQESQQKMQMEMSELYKKHGTSPFGGCLPVLVQFPIIIALFSVLRKVPAYIGRIKDLYIIIVEKIISQPGYSAKMMELNDMVKYKVSNFDPKNTDQIIDVLSSLGSSQWQELYNRFPEIQTSIIATVDKIHDINTAFGINLADAPNLMTIGVLIPILNVVVQFISMKLTTQSQGGQQAGANNTMMYMMPLMTAFFVTTMPAGLGLYWLVGSLFQVGQQIFINKTIKKE